MLEDTVREAEKCIILFLSIVLKQLILEHWEAVNPPVTTLGKIFVII